MSSLNEVLNNDMGTNTPVKQSFNSNSSINGTVANSVPEKGLGYNRVLYTKTFHFEFKITIYRLITVIIIIGLVITIAILATSNFENKNYDPYGGGIRFLQSRDDTGSPNTSLEERQYNSKVSQLTSTPEAPNFSEYYGIDASIKNGSVMIERENFENKPLSVNDLEMANKGLL